MTRLAHCKISRKVMIELLVAEGVRWAGWYRPARLEAKYDEVFGKFMQGSHGRPFSVVHRPGYLPGDRKGRGYSYRTR